MAGGEGERMREFYDEETRRVVEILKKADPEGIIHFSSVTRGDLRQGSDLDLRVLINEEAGEPRFRLKQRLFKLLFAEGYRHPISLDFIYMSTSRRNTFRASGRAIPS